MRPNFRVKKWSSMNNLLKSVLKTAIYFLDQSDRMAGDIRDRVTDTVDRASDRLADIGERTRDLYPGEDHSLRKALTFAAGVGVGIGAALLFAPVSGEEVRSSIGEKVQGIGDRVRGRFSPETRTGTEAR
jgi:hypothetical protein